jgi:hypothetical protein
VDRFLRVGPALHRHPAHSCLPTPSSPNSPLCSARVATQAKSPLMSRPAVTTPRHNDSRVFACQPESSSQLRCTKVSHHHCPPVSSLISATPVRFRSRPLSDEVLEQAAPQAKLPLPNACSGGHCLALPTHVHSHVDRVCWHSPLCHMARLGSDAPSTSPPLAAKGQRQACIASTRGHRSSRSLRRLHPRTANRAQPSASCQGRVVSSIPSTLRPHS